VLALLRATSVLASPLHTRPERVDPEPADLERLRFETDPELKRLIARHGPRMFSCVICGRSSLITWGIGALRESILCLRCGSFNRQRQLATVVLRPYPEHRTLRDFGASGKTLRVYNTEAYGAVHDALESLPGYVASEFLDAGTASGETIDGQLHQDLQQTSFPDAAFDLVLSADVFEHVPDPYRAHAEVMRILAPGGRHVMTVPIDLRAESDVTRATLDAQGAVQHHTEPEFHGDQLRPDGILVYTSFGREMLDRCAAIGFDVSVFQLRALSSGLLGANNFVIELRKPRGDEG
jgi:SAM-dependent methyltransferase